MLFTHFVCLFVLFMVYYNSIYFLYVVDAPTNVTQQWNISKKLCVHVLQCPKRACRRVKEREEGREERPEQGPAQRRSKTLKEKNTS